MPSDTMNVKIIAIATVVILVVAGIAVGIGISKDDENGDKSITVTDGSGNTHTFDGPVNKVVVFSKYIGEAMILMGANDKVVGCYTTIINDVNYGPYYTHATDLGSKTTGDTVVSQIAVLQPDVIISHNTNDNSLLKTTGVPVLEIGASRISEVHNDITILGKILGMEAKAKKILDWFDPMYDSLKNIAPSSSQITFGIESHSNSKLSMCTPTSTPGETFAVAGITNIYQSGSGNYVYPAAGDVIPLNPGILLVVVYKSSWSTTVLEPYDDALKNRAGWDQIDAVKNDKVYYVSNDICGGIRAVVGAMFALSLYDSNYANFNVEDTMLQYNSISNTNFDTDLVWTF